MHLQPSKVHTRALANFFDDSRSAPNQVQDMTLTLQENPHACMLCMTWVLPHMPILRLAFFASFAVKVPIALAFALPLGEQALVGAAPAAVTPSGGEV